MDDSKLRNAFPLLSEMGLLKQVSPEGYVLVLDEFRNPLPYPTDGDPDLLEVYFQVVMMETHHNPK